MTHERNMSIIMCVNTTIAYPSYCMVIVFPMSTNFLSSKIKKSCLSAIFIYKNFRQIKCQNTNIHLDISFLYKIIYFLWIAKKNIYYILVSLSLIYYVTRFHLKHSCNIKYFNSFLVCPLVCGLVVETRHHHVDDQVSKNLVGIEP